MIQHSQCDYQKDHRSFVVKVRSWSFRPCPSSSRLSQIEFEAADRRGMAMTIPHVPTTYVHASARREEASHESTTETACDSPSCYKLRLPKYLWTPHSPICTMLVCVLCCVVQPDSSTQMLFLSPCHCNPLVGAVLRATQEGASPCRRVLTSLAMKLPP